MAKSPAKKPRKRKKAGDPGPPLPPGGLPDPTGQPRGKIVYTDGNGGYTLGDAPPDADRYAYWNEAGDKIGYSV